MGLFFIYSLKVAFCLIAFYLLFKLLLSKETFHSFNRLVLLLIMVVSILLPWVKVTTAEPTAIAEGMISIESVIASAEVVDSESPEGLTAIQLLFIIYIIGIAVFFLREVVSVFSLIRLIRRGTPLTAEQAGVSQRGVQVVVMKNEIAPFSWFRHVVLSEKDFREKPREILTHELAHIRLGHSWDVAVCNLLIIFQWWNPAAWLLKRELQNVHEFEADEAVIKRGVDAKQYQMLLIKKSVGEHLFSMANYLNYHSLKTRITMMQMKQSNPWHKMKALVVVPMAALAVVAFANPHVDAVAEQIQSESDAVVSQAVTEMKNEMTPTQEQPLVQVEETEENVEVVGKVVDTDSKPVIGAAILIRGTKKGSVTDPEGLFRMKDVPVGSWIDVMYVGYKTVSMQVTKANASKLSFVMEKENASNGKVFDVVEQMPQFPGGMPALMKWLQDNMKYPKEAQDAKQQGRVIVSFVVEKDGSITNVRVVKSVAPALDEEAIRVVKAMPNWSPGMQNGEPVRVNYTVPISFQLYGGKTDVNAPSGSTIHMATPGNVQPLYVVDGKEMNWTDIQKIDPAKIESMTILKNEDATKKYGEKGKNGVVVIQLKK